MASRPQRMLQGGRLPNQHFDPGEKLFLRVSVHQIENGRVLPAAIRQPSFSVNRGSGSQPKDVLIPSCGVPATTNYIGLGVAAFPVSAVTQPAQVHSSVPNDSISLLHLPCADNYFHAEVRTLFKGEFSNRRKVGEVAKRHLRLRVCREMAVIVRPTLF